MPEKSERKGRAPGTSKTSGAAKRRARKNREGNSGLRGDSTSYHGPIVLPKAMGEQRIYNTNCSYTSAFTASAGTITLSINTSLVQNTSGWVQLAAEWHEYRVVAMEVIYVPILTYQTATIAVYPPCICVVDRATNSALGSYAGAADHESAQMFNLKHQYRRTIRMDGPEESVWTPVGTAFSFGYIKFYATGCDPAGATYGRGMYRFLLQLRGKQ
jgi:hypothetical protein